MMQAQICKFVEKLHRTVVLALPKNMATLLDMQERIPPDMARALVKECGGPKKIAQRLGIQPRAVLWWHVRGISTRQEMYVKGAFPTAYARWKASQEKM